jgi:hypothetical protein
MAIIDKPSDYFNTKLYTGTGATHNITGVGFQPDWVWIKQRGGTTWHNLYDAVRGVTKAIASNDTYQEDTRATGLTAFGSDGFTVGSDSNANGSSNTYASWNWKAGGTASSNTDGSITSSVSANTTSGFSIVSYTGTGANATVGHGLGSAPRMMIFKNRDEGAEGWFVYHESIGNTKKLLLDETGAATTSSTFFQDTSPTSSIITLGSNHGCNGPDAMICYAFAEKQGYSKFGSYTGNGSTDGTFVYTGFKPAFVIMKRTDTTENWLIKDSVRDSFNVADKRLFANLSQAEGTSANGSIDILSNGFKQRGSDIITNASNGTYIYMAFASSPFTTSSGVPTTAR